MLKMATSTDTTWTAGPIIKLENLINTISQYLDPLKIRGLVFDFGSVCTYLSYPPTNLSAITLSNRFWLIPPLKRHAAYKKNLLGWQRRNDSI